MKNSLLPIDPLTVVRVHPNDPRPDLHGLIGYINDRVPVLEGHYAVSFDYDFNYQCTSGVLPSHVVAVDEEQALREHLSDRVSARQCFGAIDPYVLLKLGTIFFKVEDLRSLYQTLCIVYGVTYDLPAALKSAERRGQPTTVDITLSTASPLYQKCKQVRNAFQDLLAVTVLTCTPEQLMLVGEVFWSDRCRNPQWMSILRSVLEENWGRKLPATMWTDWTLGLKGREW